MQINLEKGWAELSTANASTTVKLTRAGSVQVTGPSMDACKIALASSIAHAGPNLQLTDRKRATASGGEPSAKRKAASAGAANAVTTAAHARGSLGDDADWDEVNSSEARPVTMARHQHVTSAYGGADDDDDELVDAE